MRLSSATVGFVGGLSAETVGAFLPSPPLCRWVVVVLRPRGSKWLSVDHSACSWIGVVITRGCACLWIGVGFSVVGFSVSAYRRGGIQFWVVGFSGCCGLVLWWLWICIIILYEIYYFIVIFILFYCVKS